MNIGLPSGLALALTVAASSVAWSEGRTVIRAQSPAAPTVDVGDASSYGPLIGSAPGYGQYAKHSKQDFRPLPIYNHNFGYDGGYWQAPNSHGAGAGHGQYGYGQGNCDCYGQAGPHGCPTHYQTYSHKWPQNLVYPPPVVPAGAIQYPYYTLRGPTDFFMK
jgi:hypothetical protein